MEYKGSMKGKRHSFVVGLILLILGGCARVPQYRYYTLQDVSGKAVSGSVEGRVAPSSILSLGVEPVWVPLWLDQKNLTFSDGGVRLIRHVYDRWGEPLPESLTRSMVKNLRRLTESPVSAGPWIRSARPDAIVAIEVHSIAIVDGTLQLEVFWKLAGTDWERPVEVEKVYSVPLHPGSMEFGQDTGSIAVALSQAWGDLAKGIREALSP